MKRKVKAAIDRVTATIKAWDVAEAITVTDFEDDVLDPYFFLSIDVYYRIAIPSAEERTEMFSYAGAFETTGLNRKDRFFLDDMPVRIEYKNIARFDDIIQNQSAEVAGFRDTGTYMFFRLQNSEVLFSRTDWIAEARSRITALSPQFWSFVRTSAVGRMEHCLSDVGAAAIREDSTFFSISAACFVVSVAGVLFAANRRFEPSPRLLARELFRLPALPEGFAGQYATFLQQGDTPLHRKRDVAELMARGALRMVNIVR